MKKVLIFVFIALALWKIFSVAEIKFPFLDKLNQSTANLPASSKPQYAPQCVEHMKYQKFDAAAACYKKALADDKTNPELMFFLAFSLYQNKEYSGAIFYTDFITRNFPKSKFAQPALKLNTLAKNAQNQKIKLQNEDADDYFNDIDFPSRWIKTPIFVWVEHTDNNANLKNAFYTWQSALYPLISFQMVNKKEDANIIVVFGNPPSKCSSNDAVCCTLPYGYTKNPKWIGKAEIYITRFTRYGTRLSDNDIYGILVHEIGHAIGLIGHSKNKSDVMYPSTDNYNLRPTRRDINTVKRIYASINPPELYLE